MMGGMFGAIGVLAALYQRKSTSRGEEVKSALCEKNVSPVAQHMMEALMTGKPVTPMPDRIRAWAVYDTFTAADGEQAFSGCLHCSSGCAKACRQLRIGR